MRFAGRTIHGIPRHARAQAEHPILRIEGSVASPVDFTHEQVSAMPHRRFLEIARDVSGGTMPGTDWTGVTVADILSSVELLPGASFCRVCGGPYCAVIDLAEDAGALVCDSVEGRALGVDDGGPWRLAVPGTKYFQSVKWIDRIEVTTERPDDSSSRIAAARAKARAATASKSS